jgi:hypothetical protein
MYVLKNLMNNNRDRQAILKLYRRVKAIETPFPDSSVFVVQYGSLNILIVEGPVSYIVAGLHIGTRGSKAIQIDDVTMQSSETPSPIEVINPEDYGDRFVYPEMLPQEDFINGQLFSGQSITRERPIKGLITARLWAPLPSSARGPQTFHVGIKFVSGEWVRTPLILDLLPSEPDTLRRKPREPLFPRKERLPSTRNLNARPPLRREEE